MTSRTAFTAFFGSIPLPSDVQGIDLLPQTVPDVQDPILLRHPDPVEGLQHVLQPSQDLDVHVQVVRVSDRGLSDVHHRLGLTDVPELAAEIRAGRTLPA